MWPFLAAAAVLIAIGTILIKSLQGSAKREGEAKAIGNTLREAARRDEQREVVVRQVRGRAIDRLERYRREAQERRARLAAEQEEKS